MNKRAETAETISPFMILSQINVNEHVEKKNGLSYLSWPWAVAKLFENDPSANWEFHEPKMYGNSMMVSCTVTAFNKPITMHLPVMDHRNKAIENPDAFAVNKNMMRCLVKAIACHGLGLYIFSGEDLPEHEAEAFAKKASEKGVTPTAGAMDNFTDDERKFLTDLAKDVTDASEIEIVAAIDILDKSHLEHEEKIAVWSLLDSKVRSAIKRHKESQSFATQA